MMFASDRALGRYLRLSHRTLKSRVFCRVFATVGFLTIITLQLYTQSEVKNLKWNDIGALKIRDRLENEENILLSMYGGFIEEGRDREGDLLYIDMGWKDEKVAVKDNKGQEEESPLAPPNYRERRRQLMAENKALLSAKDFYKRELKMQNEGSPTPKSEFRTHNGLPLQPWASENRTLDAEAKRFLKFITSTQNSCQKVEPIGCHSQSCHSNWPWWVCYKRLHPDGRGQLRPGCVVYSFSPSFPALDFENDLADAGCEVHVFDPTQRSAKFSSRHPGSEVKSRNVIFHRMSLDWRKSDTNINPFGQSIIRAKNLQTIMEELGHEKVDILRADLESSEWKIMEAMVLDGTIGRVHQFLFTAHLHWSGFEVSGSNADVVRFWYSAIYGLSSSHLSLFIAFLTKENTKYF